MNKREYEKMLSGEVYSAIDEGLLEELNACKDRCWEYNQIRPTLIKERNEKLHEILGRCDEDTFINQPFFCDYGKHIQVGKRFFANFNWTVLDEAMVTIGDDCFIGPNVSIYTACHSTDPVERNTRKEWARPVTIGNNCWIGGSVSILPGVSIGDNVTIGAGSVVVKDIPSGSVAVGNPAKIIKRICEKPMTIDTTNMCSHLQKKLFEPDGVYYPIWQAMQDDETLTAVVRSRQLHIYRNGKKILVLAGKAQPKVIREDKLNELITQQIE